ncbi:MAG: N-acetylmuramoyl-L-alanine amidase [Clostridia bacterium]|nr:N-acetylmuramoyl-L-alanine amidase [Clostridia bacterium]
MERKASRALTVMLSFCAVFLFFYAVFFRQPDVRVSGAAEDKPCVVIDPGHGGEDGGATGISGAREAELNLAVALRLRDLLSLCGVRTAMIREQDIAVYSEGCSTISEKKGSDLKGRVRMVNETPGALLVSIHQNFFEQSKYYGAQVFYAPTKTSDQWADQTQQLLRECVDSGNRRESKPASSVYLMKHVNCPAILVECGFLSNPGEEKKLQESSYQKSIACALCISVNRYLAQERDTNEV